MVDLALQLAWRRGRLAIAASMALWPTWRCSLPANLARQLAWCRDWPLPQLAWQLGSVDLRSRLAKQGRGVDHRRIAIQRKRKVQIVTKVVNSGALKGPFLAK